MEPLRSDQSEEESMKRSRSIVGAVCDRAGRSQSAPTICLIATISAILALPYLAHAAAPSLADAAMQGDIRTVRELLKQRVDVNTAQGDGMTALHWATFRDNLEMARLLVQAGASVKSATRIGAITPLFMACNNGSVEMIQLLLGAGADGTAVNT